MREKSHKGQKHKGCGLCDTDKRAGNGQERRPIRDRRQLERVRDHLAPTRSEGAAPAAPTMPSLALPRLGP